MNPYDLQLAEYGYDLDLEGTTVVPVLKFGSRPDVGTTFATVAQLGGSELHETYATTNAISHVVSSSASDTDQTLTVYGHTIAAGVLTGIEQTVDLNGQTKVPLGTALGRIERAYVSSGSALVGDVYVFEDGAVTGGVPDTDSDVHAVIPAADNQTLKAALSVADGEWMLVSRLSGSINKKTAGYAELKLQKRDASAGGGPWRTQYTFTVASQGSSTGSVDVEPWMPVGPNNDLRIVAEADGVSTPVSAQIHGLRFREA